MQTITRLVTTLLSRLHRSEQGQALVLGVIAFVAIIGFTALAIDVGAGFGERANSQRAADAATLAATDALEDGKPAAQVVKVAEDWAKANGYVDGSDGATVTVNVPPLEGPYAGDSDYVEVIITVATDTYFASVFGQDFWDITARAVGGGTAPVTAAGTDASIVTLNQSQCNSLNVNANSNFTSEGAIMINSDCGSFAAEFGCNDICKAQGGIQSVGGVKTDSNCNPCTVTAISQFADPLASVLPPCFTNSPKPCQDIGPLTVQNGSPGNPQPFTGSCKPPNNICQPGIYYGGMDLNPNVAARLASGVYVMAGGGFKVNSNSSFTAEGVFIYNTNDPDCPSCSNGGFGPIILNTNDAAKFSPMTTGPYAGLLMFQDRANSEKMVINNNSSLGEGTVYTASAHIDFNPNDAATLQLIADTIKINNNDHFIAVFDGDKFYSGGEGGFIRLVE